MYTVVWKLVKILWAIVFLAIGTKMVITNYDSIEKIPTIIKNKLTSIKIKTSDTTNDEPTN